MIGTTGDGRELADGSEHAEDMDPRVEPASGHVAPEMSVRGERFLLKMDRAFGWLDGLMARLIPGELNPLVQAGRACNFAILVAVVSGVLLLLWYSPSLQSAYSSLQTAQAQAFGSLVRAAHRYSSDLVMLFVLIHAARMFFARKFAGAKWVAWVSGVGLMGLLWFIGWTGYWLVWDQPAQHIATASMRLLDAAPIFGEPMGRLYVSDRMVPSLLFFVVFFLHMLLPLGIAVGLAMHLLRVSRIKLLPNWRLGVALTIGVLVASMLFPAPLNEPARMAVKAEGFVVDAWFQAPLAVSLRFQQGGVWLALGSTVAAAMLLPWILGRKREPSTYQTRVETSRCHACTQCVQDCPFDAVTMVTRSDGKRFASQAYVDPAKCVGCGVCVGSCDSEAMSLQWFDTRREEARIVQEVGLALREKPCVAFVAGDIDSGFALYRAGLWRERLPGYQVQFVPTASWVRPKLVERLFQAGVQGILIVRDARAEAAARDGNRWVLQRLQGERHPNFRAARAGSQGRWCVLDYDGFDTPAFLERAKTFAKTCAEPRGLDAPVLSAGSSGVAGEGRRWKQILGGTAIACVLAIAVVVPSRLRVMNPAPSNPEFVFSFRALGDHVAPGGIDAAADASKPVHMRGRSREKPHRSDVLVRVEVDGERFESRHRAKGISRDGPALSEWRKALTPGAHRVSVEVIKGPASQPERWDGTVIAQSRRLHVLTFDAQTGFRMED